MYIAVTSIWTPSRSISSHTPKSYLSFSPFYHLLMQHITLLSSLAPVFVPRMTCNSLQSLISTRYSLHLSYQTPSPLLPSTPPHFLLAFILIWTITGDSHAPKRFTPESRSVIETFIKNNKANGLNFEKWFSVSNLSISCILFTLHYLLVSCCGCLSHFLIYESFSKLFACTAGDDILYNDSVMWCTVAALSVSQTMPYLAVRTGPSFLLDSR